jgi:hypothetical protein
MAGRGGATVIARARKFSPVEDGPIAMVSAEVSRLKTSIDGAIMTAKAKKLHPMVDGSIAMVSSEVSRWKTRVRECNIVKVVDTFLGGAGIAVSMAGLAVIESKFAVKMFSPPMMASALIFFSPEHPPGPRNFFSGTLAGGTAGGAIFHLVTRAGMRPPVAAGLAVGALFMWFKATNTIFPPAAVLTALSAGAISQAGSSSLRALAKANSKFLVFPWAAGHACLYASAMAFGEVRTAAHSWLSLRELQTLPQKMKGMNLRDVFNTFDTSGDGHLDSMELKMALRKATGMDVSMNRVNAIIRAIDVNGDGFVWCTTPSSKSVTLILFPSYDFPPSFRHAFRKNMDFNVGHALFLGMHVTHKIIRSRTLCIALAAST